MVLEICAIVRTYQTDATNRNARHFHSVTSHSARYVEFFFFYKSDHNTYFPAKVLAEGKLCDRFPSSKEVREKEEVRKEEEWGGKEGEREKKEEELKKKTL